MTLFRIYFTLVTSPIFIVVLQCNTHGFVRNILPIMLKFTVSKTSETSKMNSTANAGISVLLF